MAAELCDTLIRTTKVTAKLEAMQAIFPSITKFGMAALLPGRKISVDEDMGVYVEELPTSSTQDREKVLCASNMSSVAIQYKTY